MQERDRIPTLLQLMFGDSAPAAQEGASERLMIWARAFDEWLEERASVGYNRTKSHLLNSWKQLLSLVKKPPWQMTPEDIEGYRDYLEKKGLATVRFYLLHISQFFEWCDQRSIDRDCGASFNPAAGVPRPKIKYNPPRLLSQAEAEALLAGFKKEDSLLSQRDYAFFLSRFRLGVPYKLLRELKWGQIEMKDGQAWVNWGSGRPKTKLPGEVWEAIRSYLEHAGRIGKSRPGGMPGEAFIFAPLAEPFGRRATGLASEWNEGRCQTLQQLNEILKIYARKAGIDEDQLTMSSLRLSVAAWNLKDSPGKAETDAFMGYFGRYTSTQYRWKIRQSERKQTPRVFKLGLPTTNRIRKPHIFTREGSYRHGYYTPDLLPAEQVEAIMAEGNSHMIEEAAGLEFLMDRAVDLLEKCLGDHHAYSVLGNAHLLCTERLVELMKFEKEALPELDEDDQLGVDLIRWNEERRGEPIPDMEAIWRMVDEDDPPNARRMEGIQQHIARDRLILRNMLEMAKVTEDPITYAGYLEKYSRGCAKLIKLLHEARPEAGRILAFAERLVGKALADTREAYGLPRGEETLPPRVKGKRKRGG